IRLNIGLVEYRRGNYAAAIAPFTSVLRDQPDSQQARYLLGLCQVFTKKYAEAVTVLEPLWAEKSNDVLYLYLLDIAAVESGQKSLDERILSRMIAVGGGTAEFHLILGKAYLNRDEIPEATSELEIAAALHLAPDITGGHFLRGRILAQLGRENEAKAEFALAQKKLDTQLGKERESREKNRVPNPELMREPEP